MSKKYCIRLVEFVGIGGPNREPVPAGAWLASYEPEAHNGRGDARWTMDPAKALTFDTPGEAMELYRARPRRRPVRPDGRPNRPLTAATVEIVPWQADVSSEVV